MSYKHQINILEAKLKQLQRSDYINEVVRVKQIENELNRLKRLEWEENYERVKLDDER